MSITIRFKTKAARMSGSTPAVLSYLALAFDANGEPVPGGSVRIPSPAAPSVDAVFTLPDGNYSFKGYSVDSTDAPVGEVEIIPLAARTQDVLRVVSDLS